MPYQLMLHALCFTNTPFAGDISGPQRGGFRKGENNGNWLSYFDNGQLSEHGKYKDGNENGVWKYFDEL